jgi:hypothetical protein
MMHHYAEGIFMENHTTDKPLPDKFMTDKLEVGQLDRMELNIASGTSMGLKGVWALVGNSTAMVALAIVMFIMINQVMTMHHEGIATLRAILDVQTKDQATTIRDNTNAVRDLANEVKALRVETQKHRP